MPEPATTVEPAPPGKARTKSANDELSKGEVSLRPKIVLVAVTVPPRLGPPWRAPAPPPEPPFEGLAVLQAPPPPPPLARNRIPMKLSPPPLPVEPLALMAPPAPTCMG